jgi:hypothetical protein
MRRRRRGDGDVEEIVILLRGLGLLLMSMDERLQRMVILLGGSDDEADS